MRSGVGPRDPVHVLPVGSENLQQVAVTQGSRADRLQRLHDLAPLVSKTRFETDGTSCESRLETAEIPDATERYSADRGCTARLFRCGGRRKHVRADPLLPPPSTAGVYLDIEDLKNAEHARAVIGMVVEDWPDSLPSVRRLYLYARADKTSLWRAWATRRFRELEIRVCGIERFARESKNSAGMAIVADAVAD